MVTRSDLNYKQHCIDVYNILVSKYGETKAKKFITHYKNRYDKYNRSYIDYNLAYALYPKYLDYQKFLTIWIAVVGEGGTGKSTLARNICYFFDEQFSNKFMARDWGEWVKLLDNIPVVAAKRAIAFDEPDNQYHMMSREGVMIRDIVGKMRQQQLCMVFCATNLTDIPTYIYNKLNIVIFLPYLGTGLMYQNYPYKKLHPIQMIRYFYQQGKGYGIFHELEKKGYAVQFRSKAETPFSKEEELQYLDEKASDFKQSIRAFHEKVNAKAMKQDRNAEMKRLHSLGMTTRQIGLRFKCSDELVRRAVNS